jgi:hypothetical protein
VLILYYRKQNAKLAPIHIDRAVVEQVESFKFLCVHITKELTWSRHTKTVVKKSRHCLFPIRRLKRFGMGPQILKRFYSCTIESILTASPLGMATAWNPTARHYRGWSIRPSTSLRLSSLPSRSSIPGSVRGRPEHFSKIPATQVIDCSLSYRTAGSTDAPSLEPTGP